MTARGSPKHRGGGARCERPATARRFDNKLDRAAAARSRRTDGDCKVGGPDDQDKPGQKENCCGGGGECGYTWCSKLDKCTRSWEC